MQQLIRNNKNTVDRRVMNSSMCKQDISSQHRCCLVEQFIIELSTYYDLKKKLVIPQKSMGNWVENRGKSPKFDDTFSIHISKFSVDKIWTDISEYVWSNKVEA